LKLALLKKKKKIETSIIEKEEEIHLLICNRVWMKDILIHLFDHLWVKEDEILE